ncbi:hypothetical protein [Limnohabitans sp. T6-5]|uniref:hypothetical protein n=1 Tax=Limnohabitans sp. T6-5 TaxID=1100724 RepID=UPI0011B2214C|nr:hypothetical protein [Limnohabitans sp. T6-5]
MTDNTRPTAPHATNGYTALTELIPRFGKFAGPDYAGGQALGNRALNTVCHIYANDFKRTWLFE